MRQLVVICALFAAACGQTTSEDKTRPAPVPEATNPPPLAQMSPREALLDCAGAIVAHAGLNPTADPSLGTPEENAYFTVLALMDREPGLEGQAGRQAAAASSDAWMQRSADQRAARAGECMTRWPG